MEFFISEANITSLFCITFFVVFISLTGVVFLAIDYIQVLLYIELALLAININFVYLSLYFDDITAQIFVIFILSVAAAESAIALSIFITLYRTINNIFILLY